MRSCGSQLGSLSFQRGIDIGVRHIATFGIDLSRMAFG